jgi:hypothetical protein
MRLTPDEASQVSGIVSKRAELFASVELAGEIEALKAQLAAVVGRPPRTRRSAGRSRSPRCRIKAMVECVRPEPGKTIAERLLTPHGDR